MQRALHPARVAGVLAVDVVEGGRHDLAVLGMRHGVRAHPSARILGGSAYQADTGWA
jgi:hypothetical protein